MPVYFYIVMLSAVRPSAVVANEVVNFKRKMPPPGRFFRIFKTKKVAVTTPK